jgi:hypothetical protein
MSSLRISILSLGLLFSSLVFGQFTPFAIWQKKDTGDPCAGNPPIGTVCTGGALYAGIFQGGNYMVTPSGCTNSANPTCAGGFETTTKTWHGTGGSNSDIPGVTNNAGGPSLNTERGHVITPLIVDHSSTTADSAAAYCQDMTYGGYDDWYLPSKSEMAYIYCKSVAPDHNTAQPEESPNCVDFGGKTSDLPQPIQNWEQYWVATPNWAGGGWRQNWQGHQFLSNKSEATFVRCVRRY